MRLIDADTLRKEVEKDRDASDMPKMWYQGVEYAINHIIHAPTVDPIKHGHWTIEDIITYERSYGGTLYEPVYKCSCCGRVTESYVRGDEPIMPEDADFPEFCGNCGAKMDEMKVNNSKGIDLWMTKEDFNSLYEDDVEDGV